MPRQRDPETKARDAQAVAMKRHGLTYEYIAEQLGLSSRSSAFEAVQRGYRDFVHEDNPVQRLMAVERLDDALRTAYRIMMAKHVKVSNAGKVVTTMDANGNRVPVLDDSLNLQAALAIKSLEESRRKLLGLDAPARKRVEVITQDMVDAEISQLLSEEAASRHAEQMAEFAGDADAILDADPSES